MSYHTVRSRVAYTRRRRLSDISKLCHSQRGADDAECKARKAVVGESVERAVAGVLTLDDFGGRSDALGG
jgi:hypothetical protein